MTTPLMRLLRGASEKLFGRSYEGPEPPVHFRQMVVDFRAFYPRASAEQWAEMAGRLAESAYREGFQQGYESSNLDPDVLTRLPPELEADQLDPTWRERPVGPGMANPLDQANEEIEPAAYRFPEE